MLSTMVDFVADIASINVAQDVWYNPCQHFNLLGHNEEIINFEIINLLGHNAEKCNDKQQS